ncbi:MAG: DUF3043 domain-containing protein [Cellulomonadaceae bacterium]
MFSKKPGKADEPIDASTPTTPEPYAAPGKKEGPTPRRKDAEARNKVPLVPTDRRAASKAQRARDREIREQQYKAMQTGDERHMPLRDRGPVRRYVRDYVDARRSLGEYFLIIAVVFMVAVMFTAQNLQLNLITTLLLYVVVFATIIDAVVMWKKLKAKLVAKFGADKVNKSLRWYAVMRVFQIRRARLPKPMVKHGQFPS